LEARLAKAGRDLRTASGASPIQPRAEGAEERFCRRREAGTPVRAGEL